MCGRVSRRGPECQTWAQFQPNPLGGTVAPPGRGKVRAPARGCSGHGGQQRSPQAQPAIFHYQTSKRSGNLPNAHSIPIFAACGTGTAQRCGPVARTCSQGLTFYDSRLPSPVPDRTPRLYGVEYAVKELYKTATVGRSLSLNSYKTRLAARVVSKRRKTEK